MISSVVEGRMVSPSVLRAAACLGAALLSGNAAAVPILWDSPLTISADTDVRASGVQAYGYNLTNSNQTVNGVTFTGASSTTSIGGGNVTFTGFNGGNTTSAYNFTSASAFNSLSSAYKGMLIGGNYSSGATSVTVSLNNLTVGRTYLAQVWVGDPRSGTTTTRTETISGANTQTLDYNVGNAGGAVGQYALGLFAADSASQSFTLLGNSSTQINALQVRDVTNIGRWTGAAGATWDAASSANFATNHADSALAQAVFDTAKTALGGVVFADSYFNAGAATAVANSTLALGSAVTTGTVLFDNSTATYTVGASGANAIGGATRLAKSGSGTAILTGTNSYSGGTHVLAGTLAGAVSGVDSALGSGSIAVASGATLRLNVVTGSNDATVGEAITGSGTVVVNIASGSSGNTRISDLSGFTGTLRVAAEGPNSNKFRLESGITSSGSLVIESGAQLFQVAGTTSFAGGIVLNGSGNNEDRGAIRFYGGTISSAISLGSSATINPENGDKSLGGAISSGAAGTQVLTIGTASIGGNMTLNGVLGGGTGTLGLTMAGSGRTLTLTAANTFQGPTTVSAGTLAVTGSGRLGGVTYSGNISLTGGLTFSSSASQEFSGTISGAGGLTKNTSTSSVLTLSGVNSGYSGGIEHLAGTLRVASVASLGTGSLAVKSGATLDYRGTGAETLVNPLWLDSGASTFHVDSPTGVLTLSPSAGNRNQSLTKTGSGTLVLGGALSGAASLSVSAGKAVVTATNSHSGATAVAPGATLEVGNGGTAGTLAGGAITNNGTLAYKFSSSGTASLSSAVTGSGSLSAEGRRVVLGANLSQSGSVTLSQLGAAASLYDGIELAQAGTTSIVAGSIEIDGDIGKQGSNGNTLALSTAAANGAIDLNVSLGRSGVWYVPAALTAAAGSGTITISGSGAASTGWRDTPVTLSGGAVNLTSAVSSNASVAITNTAASSFTAAFNGSMSLSKSGSGTLAVSAAQGFSGSLTVNAGTYLVDIGTTGGNSSALGNGSATNTLAIGSGGTLEFKSGLNRAAGYHQANVTLGGGSIVADAGDLNLAVGSTIAFDTAAGSISGSGMLRRRSANNAVTVSAAASGSTISVAQLNLLDSAAAFTVANGDATDDLAVSSSLTGGAELVKAGAGRLRLTNAGSHTGALTVNAGELSLASTHGGSALSVASGAVLELDSAGTNRSHGATSFSGAGTVRVVGGQEHAWGAASATFALGSGSHLDVQAGTFVGGSSANEVWTNNRSRLTVASGAVFRGVEANVRVDSLGGAGTISSGWSGEGYVSFTFGVDGGSGSFSGVLADQDAAAGRLGAFVKAGAGTQTLTGASTFTGGLTVSQGSVVIGTGGSVASAIVNNAVLGFDHSDAKVHGGLISGTGSLSKSGSGQLTLSGNNNYQGGTTLNEGTLVLGSATGFGGGDVVVLGGTLDLGGRNPANVIRFTGGSITGDQNWTSGSVSLSGAINAASVNALGASVVVAIRSGSSVSLNGVTRAITLDGGSISSFGDFSGTLNLATSLDLDGAGDSPVTTSAAVVVGSGATLSGVGTVASLAGAGTVGPGNSPGILTSVSLDPSAGTDFNLEFTQFTPAWSSPSSSDNDVIRLTGATPFASAMTSANVVNLYLAYYDPNVGPLPTLGDTFVGGFYTDADADFLGSIQTATFNFYVPVAAGGISYNGAGYELYSGPLQFDVQTVRLTGAFEAGTPGYAMQIQAIPEPSTYGLVLGALALAATAARRRRR